MPRWLLRLQFASSCALSLTLTSCNPGPPPNEPSVSVAKAPAPDAVPPDTSPSPASSLPAMPIPFDADCRDENPQKKRGKTNKLACSNLDRSDPARVDALYHAYVWDTFVAINLPENEPLWAIWSREESQHEDVKTNKTCGPIPDTALLAKFETPTWHAPPAADIGLAPEDNPVWDQDGVPVEYEILFNEAAGYHFQLAGLLDTIDRQLYELCTEGLRNGKWGHLEWTTKRGVDKPGAVGPIHLKLAWKHLGPDDDRSRFLIDPRIPSRGLVAMHVILKPETASDFWIWSTFGHVDNVEGDDPLFRDPDCPPERCPPNTGPEPGPDGKRRTQIERITPLEAEVIAINQARHAELARHDSVLQYYQLVGVQRPERAYAAKPAKPGEALAVPRPGLLANEIFEWDRQETSCIGCHSMATVWSFASGDQARQCEKLCPETDEGKEERCAGKVAPCPTDASAACLISDGDAGSAAPLAPRWRSFQYPAKATHLVTAADMFWQHSLMKLKK